MSQLKIIFPVFLFLLMGTGRLFSQTHTVKGKIINKNNSTAVADVSVFLPDLNRSTTSDVNGNFVLRNLPGTAQKFTFVCLGYHSLTRTYVFTDSLTEITVALEPGSRDMEEVVVVGTQSHTENQAVTSVASLSQRNLRSRGALSISDGVAKLPGVSQLSTGAGISKPVIRGLYGNRIQSVVMGMRFDNQQWQDEHGLGLQDIGVERVEVIKGPAALMYGSEAMGGVINILEEKPADVDSTRCDAGLRLFSNTYGAGLDAGVRSAKENIFWRVRLGAESQADYSDGNNKRILNSRFDGYVGKASFGYSHKKWVSNNNYLFSKSDFGFIMDTANSLIEDSRIDRGFSNPHHTVFINLFTSENTFFGDNGNIFRIIAGTHINRRMENEGGGGISLDMQLLTVALHLQDEIPFPRNWTWINGMQSQYQDNKNSGARIIVPDATLAENSLYSYLKKTSEKISFEAGLRYGLRYIRTQPVAHYLEYATLATVNKIYNTVNGSVGTSVRLAEDFYFKANLTSGYRTPNLAELESNALHEGTFRYELGDPGMKIEQNFCAEAGFSLEKKGVEINVTAYNNRFLDYIYLQPTNIDFYGLSLYKIFADQCNVARRRSSYRLDAWKNGLAGCFGFLFDDPC